MATRTVETLDAVAPELVSFVSAMARGLDVRFPDVRDCPPQERGQWTGDDGITTYMVQGEQFDDEGRGIRTIRLFREDPEGEPSEAALRVIAVGLANDATLELRWNVIASAEHVRGTSVELTVDHANRERCLPDFLERFGDPVN